MPIPRVLILGEGPTEFYYVDSLRDLFRGIQYSPSQPKHSSIDFFRKKIEEGLYKGYRTIICLIDMDNKDNKGEACKYAEIRNRYKDDRRVVFLESERCTELFFLYYFCYTTRIFDNQPSLLRELSNRCPYEKTVDFFKKHPLHGYFESNGGSLSDAIDRAKCSCSTATERDSRTYTELHRLFSLLNTRCPDCR